MIKRIAMLAALALPFVVNTVARADDSAPPAKKAKKGKKAKKDAAMDDKKMDAPAAGGDAKPADAPANP